MSFRAQINLALGAALVLLLLLALGSSLTIRSLLIDADEEHSSQDSILQVERVVSDLKTAESLQRRYLLTGAAADLQAFEQARRQAAQTAAAARHAPALEDEPEMAELEAAIRRRLDSMGRTVTMRQQSGLQAATVLVSSDAARQLREQIDGLETRLRGGVSESLRQSRKKTHDSAWLLQFLIPAAGVVSTLVLGWAIVLVNMYHRARQRAERELKASDLFVRQVTDVVPALLAFADADQRLQFHNRAYRESLGHAEGEVIGRTLPQVLGEARWEAVGGLIAQAYAGQNVRYERTGLDAQGRVREYEMKYFPRYGEGPDQGRVVGVYALGTDVTDFKRIDRMKSEFVSTVSHELRTPLTSIRGSLGLIAGGVTGVLPEKALELVHIANDNCERLIRIINDILDSEKIESGQVHLELRPCALKPLLQQALVANEGFAAQHQVGLALSAPDEGIAASVDADRQTQVVTNLLSNACKFSPSGSTVQVVLSAREGRVTVAVQDQGPGISAEFRSRIFRKFSQADASDTRKKGGTGLGLNISRALVERMGGMLDFRDGEHGGTVFFFELPQVAQPENVVQAGPLAQLPVPRSPSERPLILVCEDNADIAQLIAMMLDKAGFDSEVAPSAEQALQLLAGRKYSAMTVDLHLPGRDGISLIQAVRADAGLRELPVVVVSATAEEGQLRFRNRPLMVAGWLLKPIDENLLIRGLRRAMQNIADERPRILHVEDDRDIQRITAAISDDVATFVTATTLEEARRQLRAGTVDAVLLDLDMGEGQERGSSLFEDLDDLNPIPPVVIYSATDVTDSERVRAAAVLLKSGTSNEELRNTLAEVLARIRKLPHSP